MAVRGTDSAPIPQGPEPRPSPEHHEQAGQQNQPENGDDTDEPVASGREHELQGVRTLRKQLPGHQRARGFPIDGILDVETGASTFLRRTERGFRAHPRSA